MTFHRISFSTTDGRQILVAEKIIYVPYVLLASAFHTPSKVCYEDVKSFPPWRAETWGA